MTDINLNKLSWQHVGKTRVEMDSTVTYTTFHKQNPTILEAWESCWSDDIFLALQRGWKKKFSESEYRHRVPDLATIKKFVATRIRLIHEKQSSYTRHWKKSKGKWRPEDELHLKKYRILTQNIRIDLGWLYETLSSNFRNAVEVASSSVVVDELVAGNNIRSPVRIYMPRKPHPNGHLVYMVGVKTECGWFIAGLCPYVEKGNRPTATGALINLVSNSRGIIPLFKNCILVGDNAFCTVESINFLLKNGMRFLLSVNQYPSKGY